MEKLVVSVVFEHKNLEVDEKFLTNVIEFGIRSFFGIIGGSLIHYEIVGFDVPNNEVFLECDKNDSFKISAALAMIGSYGISRIRSKITKL
jgi:hypothetical protein